MGLSGKELRLVRVIGRLCRISNLFWVELLGRPRHVGTSEGDGEQLGPGDLTILAKDGYSWASKRVSFVANVG